MEERMGEMSGEKYIIKGPTPEELKKRVIEEATEFPFNYDQFYDRMRRVLRINGIPLESAIWDAFVISGDRRITGLRPLPSKDPSEE